MMQGGGLNNVLRTLDLNTSYSLKKKKSINQSHLPRAKHDIFHIVVYFAVFGDPV